MTLEKILEDGGDRRSLAHNERVIRKIKTQSDFDALFALLSHKSRLIVMRAVDAIEKITSTKPQYLKKHKAALMEIFFFSGVPELKWHTARLIIRIPLNHAEFSWVWYVLDNWIKDRNNSKLVRVAALQSMYEMAQMNPDYCRKFRKISQKMEEENIPSVNARLRNIRRELEHKICA